MMRATATAAAVIVLATAGVLTGGCDAKSFIDPSELGRAERAPLGGERRGAFSPPASYSVPLAESPAPVAAYNPAPAVPGEKYNALTLENDALREQLALAVRNGSAGLVTLPGFAASAPEKVPGTPDVTPAIRRVVIYAGSISVVVRDTATAVAGVKSMAERAGGYMQEQDGSSIAVRVPAARFDEVMTAIGKLGEVSAKQVRASDLTEEMFDIEIRLDNARKTRERLLKLLEQSGKAEDTLKIEAEVSRLTETIEQIEGRKRFVEQQAAMSTIRASFNSPVARAERRGQTPFPWVEGLGDSVVTGRTETGSRDSGWFNRGIRLDLPKTYVRYYVEDDRTEAMSAEGGLARVQRHGNFDGASVKFWADLARKNLVERRAIALDATREVKLEAGAPAVIFRGTRDVAGERQGYLLMIAANDDHVVTFEAWGPEKQFGTDADAMERAALSVRLRK